MYREFVHSVHVSLQTTETVKDFRAVLSGRPIVTRKASTWPVQSCVQGPYCCRKNMSMLVSVHGRQCSTIISKTCRFYGLKYTHNCVEIPVNLLFLTKKKKKNENVSLYTSSGKIVAF